MTLPDLRTLALLVGVARHGSIGAAARAEGLSQQGASERVRAAEALLGVPLLWRGARGSELTAAGQVVVEWSTRLLDVAAETEVALASLREDEQRHLRVAASMTVAEHLLPRWLVRLRATSRTPVEVSMTATNSAGAVAAVLAHRASLGFVEGVEAPRGLAHAEVGSDELVLVCTPDHPLARRRAPLGPDEVAALSLTSREPGSGTREVLEEALGAHGLALSPPAVELTTSTGVREAVLAGSAPAVVSRRTVAGPLASGDLVEVPLRDLALTRTLRAVWLGRRTPPAGPVRDLVAIAAAG
ncbi:LysR family transcriptional regulator [Nocardioides sp. CFH 31398]|uniref:LysR family transcriptional regulator n=1 Tax=Nocardioides sp. CFH 31398 TaxID=2919579 RepID=UPI001F0693C7|nr:LysR family transcriptional regulator [Nocardioides sp. CFH 31398]MCH1868978.1 LysR family transcriptional regulator [Nocardioides sp. CFH 31398]